MTHEKTGMTLAQFRALATLVVGGGFIVAETQHKRLGKCEAEVLRPRIYGNRDHVRDEYYRLYGEGLMPQTFAALVSKGWLQKETDFGPRSYTLTGKAVKDVVAVAETYPTDRDWGHPDLNLKRQEIKGYQRPFDRWDEVGWYRGN